MNTNYVPHYVTFSIALLFPQSSSNIRLSTLLSKCTSLTASDQFSNQHKGRGGGK